MKSHERDLEQLKAICEELSDKVENPTTFSEQLKLFNANWIETYDRIGMIESMKYKGLIIICTGC